MKTFYVILIFFISLFAEILFSQTIVLKGKVYDDNKNPVKNISLRFNTIGSITTTNSGEFMIELPDELSSVEVETIDKNWLILYPFDNRVLIPADKNNLIKIVVSKTRAKKDLSVKEVVKNFKSLESLLTDIGVARDELKNLLENFSQKEANFYNLQKDSIRSAILNDKKNEIFGMISHALLNYVGQIKDSRNDFNLLTQISVYNHEITDAIKKSIEEYNSSVNELKNNKYVFQKDITDYWEDESLADSLLSTINFAIEEIHEPCFLKLNDYILDINRIVTGQISDSKERNKLKQSTSEGINSVLKQIDFKVPAIENKVNEIIIKLKDTT